MNWIVRILFVALLAFTAGTSDAVADCGNCGDAAHAEGAEEAGHHDKAKAGDKAACSCSKAKDGGSTWCDHCKVGQHEGKKIKCEGCYKKATGESKEGCASCTKAKGEPAKEG